MGRYVFDQTKFDKDVFDKMSLIAGRRRGGQVVFVDNEEAKLEVNRRRGINRTGWWYVKKTYKNGKVEYRTEILFPAPSNIKTRTESNYVNTGELFPGINSEYYDDSLVSDGDYKLYFTSQPPFSIAVFYNEFLTTATGDLEYTYKLLNYNETDEVNAEHIDTIIDSGISIPSSVVKYSVNFQERVTPKNGFPGRWRTFVPIEEYRDDSSFDPTSTTVQLSYTPNIDAIVNSYTNRDRENNKYEYRAILSNDVGSLEAISDSFEVSIANHAIDYRLDQFENLEQNPENPPIYGVQSGDVVDDVSLQYYYSVVGGGLSNLQEFQEYSTNGKNWLNMFGSIITLPTLTQVPEHDYANTGVFDFRLPGQPERFTTANNGLWYRLRLVGIDSQEQFVKEHRQLTVIKRKGYFSTDLSNEVSGVPDGTITNKYHVFEVDVKNNVNRTSNIGTGSYALVTNWQYREDDRVSWKNFPTSRVLGSDTMAVSAATTAIGTDIQKAAIVFDRNGIYQVRVGAKAGSDDNETEEVFSNVSYVSTEHLIYITSQPTAIASVPSGNARANVTSIVAEVAFGTLTYQWQLSLDGSTGWSNAPGAVAAGSNTNSLSLRNRDVTGVATSVYARCILSGGTFAPDIISNSVELTVVR